MTAPSPQTPSPPSLRPRARARSRSRPAPTPRARAQRLTLALIAALAVAWLAPAAALADQDGPGTRAVKGANDTIAKLLKTKVAPDSAEEAALKARVTDSVRAFLDVDMLGKRALADHWDGLKDDQKQRFLRLLRELIEQNYVKGLRANLDYQVAYKGERKRGPHLVVSTEIKAKRRGRPHTISVEYVLFNDGGTWRAFDVTTDGIGLVENYRAQFNKLIAKDGFDGLLARMERKRAALKP